MTRFFVLLLAALAITAFASLTQPNRVADAQGLACTRNSECSSPLVCMSGRCRWQCREDRDCAAGQHCVIQNPAGGSCVVDGAGARLPPDAAYCLANRDCTTGSCTQSQCRPT